MACRGTIQTPVPSVCSKVELPQASSNFAEQCQGTGQIHSSRPFWLSKTSPGGAGAAHATRGSASLGTCNILVPQHAHDGIDDFRPCASQLHPWLANLQQRHAGCGSLPPRTAVWLRNGCSGPVASLHDMLTHAAQMIDSWAPGELSICAILWQCIPSVKSATLTRQI